MKHTKRLRPPLEYLIWFILIIVLAACSQPGDVTPNPTDPTQPKFSVSAPFVLGKDGTYSATVSEN